jgi:hypothetical protein
MNDTIDFIGSTRYVCYGCRLEAAAVEKTRLIICSESGKFPVHKKDSPINSLDQITIIEGENK